MIWFKNYSLEELATVSNMPGLVRTLGISIIEVNADYLRARMEITTDLLQILEIMHGGASCALVETAGSFASRMCLDSDTHYSVGSQIQVNHLRPAVKGTVLIATCKPVHLGRQKHVWDIPVHAEDSGKLVCKGELTCAILNK